MIDVITDLHLHSKYSRAVSPQMNPLVMAQYGLQKGINILSTGDWTHPIWMRELRNSLEESEEGLYKLKSKEDSGQARMTKEVRFLLSVEIACIYSQGGKGRRIHNLVFVKSFETAEKINKELVKRGFNISSDGRPIIGLSSKNLLQLILEIDDSSLLIPAHVWTPWFGIYGQMSGFESLEEAFEELAPQVYGIETGLSSDPEMNWQMKELATRSILSFSDAHSPAKMGREATVFRLENLSYDNIRKAIMEPSLVNGKELIVNGKKTINNKPSTINKVLYTIEFYPEEGKYHYSGHRNCNVSYSPEDLKTKGDICPVCHKRLTDGVVRRVEELAKENVKAVHKSNTTGLTWITDTTSTHPPFVKIVPLLEIISEAIGSPVGSPKVKALFDEMCKKESEFNLLLKIPLETIEKMAESFTTSDNAQKIAQGIQKVRSEQIVVVPGYDGVYGVVKIWDSDNSEKSEIQKEEKKEQVGLEF